MTQQFERRGFALRAGIYSGLILVVAATAWYLRSTLPDTVKLDRPVPFVLVTDPPDCDVLLDGRPIGRTLDGRLDIELDPRNTDIRWMDVRKPGYEPTRRALSAYLGLPSMELKLRRRPFDAIVSSIPLGAEIWVGDELRGFTPMTMRLLPSDGQPIRIKAKHPGYEEQEIDIVQPGGDESARVDLTLVARAPRLRISSDPPGATVLLDGRPVGQTPLETDLDVELRGHSVRVALQMDRFQTVERSISVPRTPGDALKIDARLQPSETQLAVQTNPPGAQIRVNRRAVGISPVTVSLTPEEAGGPVRVEAVVPGAYAGETVLDRIAPSAVTSVVVPMELYARRVVFALDCAAASTPEFEMRRARAKDEVHLLQRGQQFAVVALMDGRAYVGPEPTPVWASSEQKVRAYDRLDGLRHSGPLSDPMALIHAARQLKADSVWLFTSMPIDRAEWLVLFEQFPEWRPIINLVAANERQVEPWMREWLTANRGTWTVQTGPAQALLGLDAP